MILEFQNKKIWEFYLEKKKNQWGGGGWSCIVDKATTCDTSWLLHFPLAPWESMEDGPSVCVPETQKRVRSYFSLPQPRLLWIYNIH